MKGTKTGPWYQLTLAVTLDPTSSRIPTDVEIAAALTPLGFEHFAHISMKHAD